MNRKCKLLVLVLTGIFIVFLSGCAKKNTLKGVYLNDLVDFASINNVAVLPFQNLTNNEYAADRIRDVFMGMLLATEAVYVLPPGEVYRGISRVGMVNPAAPSVEEIKSLAGILDIDVVITGVVKEYDTVRSGATSANIIAFSLQMIETETGTIIWSAATTEGGITISDRMFGGGGEPMNYITLEGVDDLLNKLFQ